MSRSQRKIPKYRHNKTTNRACVEIDGKVYWLGLYDSPESHAEYERLIGEWLSNGRRLETTPPDAFKIVNLIAAFWRHAEQYYRRPDGTQTSELDNYRQAMRPLRRLYGDLPVQDFGPRKLATVREAMIHRGWCRTNVNKQVNRIKSVFKWGVSQELIPASIHQSLVTLAPLRKGRSEARESEPVLPVHESHIEAIRPLVSRQVWALIQLQLFTAARPGELVGLRPIDLSTSDEVWTCSPRDHKTAHHGHARVIYFGPRARRVLEPFLAGRSLEAPMFSPAEAEAERRAVLTANRRTPLSCGNRPGTNRKARPKHKPRSSYDVGTYRNAIRRACLKAEIPVWTPYQLRHNAATEIQSEFGIEGARLILGHRTPNTTAIYAELDSSKALRIMAKMG